MEKDSRIKHAYAWAGQESQGDKNVIAKGAQAWAVQVWVTSWLGKE